MSKTSTFIVTAIVAIGFFFLFLGGMESIIGGM